MYQTQSAPGTGPGRHTAQKPVTTRKEPVPSSFGPFAPFWAWSRTAPCEAGKGFWGKGGLAAMGGRNGAPGPTTPYLLVRISKPLSSWAFFPVRWLGRQQANEVPGALLGRRAAICPSITIAEIIDAPGRGRSLISPKGRPALSLPWPPPEPWAGGPRPLHLSLSPWQPAVGVLGCRK